MGNQARRVDWSLIDLYNVKYPTFYPFESLSEYWGLGRLFLFLPFSVWGRPTFSCSSHSVFYSIDSWEEKANIKASAKITRGTWDSTEVSLSVLLRILSIILSLLVWGCHLIDSMLKSCCWRIVYLAQGRRAGGLKTVQFLLKSCCWQEGYS